MDDLVNVNVLPHGDQKQQTDTSSTRQVTRSQIPGGYIIAGVVVCTLIGVLDCEKFNDACDSTPTTTATSCGGKFLGGYLYDSWSREGVLCSGRDLCCTVSLTD